MDPELLPFIPMFPPADLSDPATARKNLSEGAARMPAPDMADMEIEDRAVPAKPEVPVRIYRPPDAQGSAIKRQVAELIAVLRRALAAPPSATHHMREGAVR